MKIFIGVIFILLFSSCSKSDDTINHVLRTSDLPPTEILRQLDSLCDFSKLSKKDRHNYIFLKTKARYDLKRVRRRDTMLRKSIDYFLRYNEFQKAAYLFLSMGSAYQKLKDYERASICYLEAENIAAKMKDYMLLFRIHSALGNLCLNDNDDDNALVHFEKMIKLFEEHPEMTKGPGGERMLEDLGNGLLCVGEYAQGLQLFQGLLNKVYQTRDSVSISRILYNLAYSLEKEELDAEAKTYVYKALDYGGNNEVRIKNLLLLTKIFYKEKEIDSLELVLNEVANNPGMKNINNREIYKYYLSELHFLKGDYLQAINSFKEYDAITDTTYTKKMQVRMDQVKANFKRIKMREKYLMVYNRYLIVSITCLSVFVILSLIVGILYYKIRKKRNQCIEAENFIERLNAISAANNAKLEKLLSNNLEFARKMAQLKSISSEKNTMFLKRFNEIFYEGGDASKTNWEEIYFATNLLYDGFKDRLVASFPDLNEKEVQLCCLLRAGFDTNDIAFMSEQSIYSIHKRKTSIRKKLAMEEGGDIIKFLVTDFFQSEK